MDNYYGTYLMSNGTFFQVFETDSGKLVDDNGIPITTKELETYRKID